MMLSRQNYKVRSYIGTSSKALIEYVTILDAGAGASFCKRDALSKEVLQTIRTINNAVGVRDANNRRLSIS